jgi:hypothetical protein
MNKQLSLATAFPSGVAICFISLLGGFLLTGNLLLVERQRGHLSCDESPSVDHVKEVFDAHRAELLVIAARGSNEVNGQTVKEFNRNRQDQYTVYGSYLWVSVNEYSEKNRINNSGKVCANRAEIFVTAVRSDDIEYFHAKYGSTFFDVPYRIAKR